MEVVAVALNRALAPVVGGKGSAAKSDGGARRSCGRTQSHAGVVPRVKLRPREVLRVSLAGGAAGRSKAEGDEPTQERRRSLRLYRRQGGHRMVRRRDLRRVVYVA